MGEAHRINPYQAPETPISLAVHLDPTPRRRWRWSWLRWIPFTYCLTLAAICFNLVRIWGIPLLAYLLANPGTPAERYRITTQLGACLGFLVLCGFGVATAFAWRDCLWRRAGIATVLFLGLVRWLIWSLGVRT